MNPKARQARRFIEETKPHNIDLYLLPLIGRGLHNMIVGVCFC